MFATDHLDCLNLLSDQGVGQISPQFARSSDDEIVGKRFCASELSTQH